MSAEQHPESRGFELVADLYERSRPGYPSEAVAWFAQRLDLRAGRTVLDLGAGTGKLARALVETGAHVVAVEPGEAMRARLEQAVPEAEALAGAAEAIPLADASVDAVTAGQAFHWFRADEALREVHRVLRPGGGLGLVWNQRDWDDPFQQEVSRLLEPFVPAGRPEVTASGWREELDASDLFGQLEERRLAFSNELDADRIAERIASISFVAAATARRQRALERQLRVLVCDRGGRVRFAYVTVAFVTFAS